MNREKKRIKLMEILELEVNDKFYSHLESMSAVDLLIEAHKKKGDAEIAVLFSDVRGKLYLYKTYFAPVRNYMSESDANSRVGLQEEVRNKLLELAKSVQAKKDKFWSRVGWGVATIIAALSIGFVGESIKGCGRNQSPTETGEK